MNLRAIMENLGSERVSPKYGELERLRLFVLLPDETAINCTSEERQSGARRSCYQLFHIEGLVNQERQNPSGSTFGSVQGSKPVFF